MRYVLAAAVVLTVTTMPCAAETPLVEKYLHAGELAQGEQALEAALAKRPTDDQLRFGLGVLQVIRAVERLGQSMHEGGVKSEDTNVPFLRLPVPKNPDPAPVSYTAFRRVLDDFRRDLAVAEATLAGVTDDRVKLPLRLAAVRLDLDNDGKPTDRLVDILRRLMGQQLGVLDGNPDFLVCFDRGDVAWLRAYCHLLMAMLDFYLAFDLEAQFDLTADRLFARPKKPFAGTDDKRWAQLNKASEVIVVKEPLRLGRFRRHLLQVCALNVETWKHIRAETDDDREWLPNPRQKGIFGLPVRDNMIDAWLGMVAELERLLEGKKLVPWSFNDVNGKMLNLKTLLEEPPARRDWQAISRDGPTAKYMQKGEAVDFGVVWRLFGLFNNPMGVAYAVWFN